MNMKTPRTALEALYAEILGDLTRIIERVEALPQVLSTASEGLALSSSTLDAASERFRVSAGEFTDKARIALSAQLDQKAREAALAATAELQEMVQEQVREAFATTVRADVSELVAALKAAASEHSKLARKRKVELVALSFGTAVCTAAIVIAALRML
jgi:hypothetical protein